MITKRFSQLGKSDAAIAGGKGASLGEMTQAGIPVPPGYVVLAEAFEHFIHETHLVAEIDAVLSSVNTTEMHTVEHASEKIQNLILGAQMPTEIAIEILSEFAALGAQYVAVRSSATAEDSASAAWAGQLDSFLNTDEAHVLKNVQHCWASLFTPRAIFYRFEKELHLTKISVAVVVQKMVESECSGIAFSVHPVTQDRNQLIIEAGFGLGEAIVSGQVTPDSYVVEKAPRKLIETVVSTQSRALYRATAGGNEWRTIAEPQASSQVLTEAQVLELSTIIVRIEDHYGFPCDIEWAYEGGKFYIVQSRPITTLTSNAEETSLVSKLRAIDWQKDWEGKFSLLLVAIANGPAYIERSKEILGIPLYPYLVMYKDGMASAWLPTDEYEKCGASLASRYGNERGAHELAEGFKKAADDAVALFKRPDQFRGKIEEFARINETYTAYQIATKTVANFLPLSVSPRVAATLEEARRYSETYYKEMEVFVQGVIGTITVPDSRAEYLAMMTLDELICYLASGNLPANDILRTRYQRSGVYICAGSIELLTADQVESIVASWLAMGEEGVLRGQSAFAGVVRGVCRIIKDFKGASMLPGEILVTGMTDPNFVPLMKQAAAIVTDGGGMLCHAAIISRELRIPCVVGTKRATHVLCDGDLVEVNATDGIVRILSRGTLSKDASSVQSVNPYVGSMDLAATNILKRVFTREYSVLAMCYWVEDILNHLDSFSGGRKILTKMLVMSEGADNRRVGVYYTDPEIVDFFESLQKTVNTDPGFFPAAEAHFKATLAPVRLVQDLLERKPTQGHLNEYIRIALGWYFKNVSLMHSLVDMEDISDEIKSKALEYRSATQDLDASIGVVVDNAVKKLYPLYAELSWYMRPEEVLRLDSGLSEQELQTIHSRKQDGWFILNGSFHVGSASATEHLAALGLRLDIAATDTTQTSLKGSSAHGGRVTGRVRLVQSKGDLGQLLEGEVLVAAMTNPDYVPAMKRASAVITDEGGITCHAAIVARELKKPCVIGTRFATQLLKTGDMVEVDADAGIVRIIGREESHTERYRKLESIKNAYPLDLYALERGWSDAVKRSDLGLVSQEVVLAFKDGDFDLYCDDVAWQENAQRSFAALADSQELRDALAKRSHDYIDRIRELIATIKRNDHPALFELHKSTQEMLYECIYGFSEENFTGLNSTILTDELNRIVPDPAQAAALLVPRRQSYFAKYELALLAVGENIDRVGISRPVVIENLSKEVKQEIDSLVAEYGWIAAGFNEKPKDAAAVITELNEIFSASTSVVKLKSERESQHRDAQSRRVETEQLLQKQLSAIDWIRIQLIQSLTEEAKYRIENGLELIYLSRQVYESIAQTQGLSSTQLKYLFPEEVSQLLTGVLSTDAARTLSTARSRKKYVIAFTDGILRELTDFVPPKPAQQQALKGQTAFAGRVTGTVRIVNSPDEMHKVTAGDVLVSSRTSPELVPAMTKAGAIISEVGGMLCHAAIVSREMKKPCIVGVKWATELLHDGDTVEVDADSGVVTMLTK